MYFLLTLDLYWNRTVFPPTCCFSRFSHKNMPNACNMHKWRSCVHRKCCLSENPPNEPHTHRGEKRPSGKTKWMNERTPQAAWWSHFSLLRQHIIRAGCTTAAIIHYLTEKVKKSWGKTAVSTYLEAWGWWKEGGVVTLSWTSKKTGQCSQVYAVDTPQCFMSSKELTILGRCYLETGDEEMTSRGRKLNCWQRGEKLWRSSVLSSRRRNLICSTHSPKTEIMIQTSQARGNKKGTPQTALEEGSPLSSRSTS